MLKFTIRSGYYNVTLCNNNKKRVYQVHRLVADAFILNLENKPVVNHIDENRLNNNVDNLEWCTQKENVLHSKYQFFKPKKKYKTSSSGEKYIIKRNRYGRIYFEVNIYIKGKRKYIGKTDSLEEAVILQQKYLMSQFTTEVKTK